MIHMQRFDNYGNAVQCEHDEGDCVSCQYGPFTSTTSNTKPVCMAGRKEENH